MKKIALLFGTLSAVSAAPAFAVMDVSAATAEMDAVAVAVPIVGAAILAVLGLMAAWKLARGLFA